MGEMNMNLQDLLGEDLEVEAKIESEIKQMKPQETKSEVTSEPVTDVDTTDVNLDVISEDESQPAEDVKYDKEIIPPFKDKYLKDLLTDYNWIERDGNYYIQKAGERILEQRNKYFYLAPELLEKLGFEILDVTGINGGSFVATARKDNMLIVANESVTGYYPSTITIIENDNVEVIKIKHNKKAFLELLERLNKGGQNG